MGEKTMANKIRKFFMILNVIGLCALMAYSQEEINEESIDESPVYINMDDFEIIHLSSGIHGETSIQINQDKQPQRNRPGGVSREEREKIMKQWQEIRASMRKIEDEASQQNPELQAITDKINALQQQRKTRLDELLADNQEYQVLKEKIANQNFQAAETMKMSMIERQTSREDEQIKQIDYEIGQLMRQRNSLLQTALQDNAEYQSQKQQIENFMRPLRDGYISSDSANQTGPQRPFRDLDADRASSPWRSR